LHVNHEPSRHLEVALIAGEASYSGFPILGDPEKKKKADLTPVGGLLSRKKKQVSPSRPRLDFKIREESPRGIPGWREDI
jgi:hypothetical protein